MVSSRLWNFLCRQICQRKSARPQPELLGPVGRLQILDHLRESTNSPDTNNHGHRRRDSFFANGNNPKLARRVESVVAMSLHASSGTVIIRCSISAALWLGTAISALSSAMLFRSLRTSGRLGRQNSPLNWEIYPTLQSATTVQPLCHRYRVCTKMQQSTSQLSLNAL